MYLIFVSALEGESWNHTHRESILMPAITMDSRHPSRMRGIMAANVAPSDKTTSTPLSLSACSTPWPKALSSCTTTRRRPCSSSLSTCAGLTAMAAFRHAVSSVDTRFPLTDVPALTLLHSTKPTKDVPREDDAPDVLQPCSRCLTATDVPEGEEGDHGHRHSGSVHAAHLQHLRRIGKVHVEVFLGPVPLPLW